MLHQGMYFSSVSQLLARVLNADQVALETHARTMQKLGRTHYNWSLIAKQYAALIRVEKRIPLAGTEIRLGRRKAQRSYSSISLPTLP